MSLSKLLRKIAVGGLVFTLLLNATPVWAALPGNVNTYNVNIRSRSSTGSEVLGGAFQGESVTIWGTENDFYRVTIGNHRHAYIFSDYVTPSVTIGRVNTSGVNVRMSPGLSGGVIRQAAEGEQFSVVNMVEDWYVIDHNGSVAFVNRDFLDVGQNRATPPVASAPAAPVSAVYQPAPALQQYVQTPTTQTDWQHPHEKAAEIISFSKQFLGTPYQWGGTDLRNGVDCSGFVFSVMRNFGIQLGRSSRDMAHNGHSISRSELMPADLVFFSENGSVISHVGIYIGNNYYIHSSSGRTMGVIITSLSSDWSRRTFHSARRIL